MEFGKQIANLLNSSGLMQYPDANLYNSAKKLKPTDRPTVPVRTYESPEQVEQLGGFKPSAEAGAAVGPKKDAIFVNKTKPSYKDSDRLAAVMGHEQEHVMGGDENAAKLREYQLLKALMGRWKTNPRLQHLEAFSKSVGSK